MTTHRRPRDGDAPLLPAGALPCVWMTAGLVAWKLCDREFDCEHCPLDVALRGPEHGPPAAEPGEAGSGRLEFLADRLYHPTHAWVQRVGESRLRYGLDAFAARLLDRVTAVVLPMARNRIERGVTACWVMEESEVIPLPAPVSGMVLEGNRSVQERPTLVAESPYERGWLLEVSSPGRPRDLMGLVSAEEARRLSAEHLRRLHREVSRLCAGDARVGATLADGGVRLAELRRIVGAARYHRLILEFLR